MTLSFRRAAALVAAVVASTAGAPAFLPSDSAGCSDPGGLRRFAGASIVMCEQRDFAEYVLPTGRALEYDFDAQRARFDSALSLEGQLVQDVYAGPPGASSAQVFRTYQAALDSDGFRPLFAAKQADIGPALGSFFEGMGPGSQIWGYSPAEARYLAAVREVADGATYVSLYVIEYQDGYDPKFSPRKGQVMVRLDVLQTARPSHPAEAMPSVGIAAPNRP